MATERFTEENTYFAILNDAHNPLLASFHSANGALNTFLANDALEYRKLQLGVSYLLLCKDKRLISYMTLGMGALKIPDREEFEFRGKKLREYPKEFPNQFPALLIGKLATDEKELGKGGASMLVDYAIKLALELRQKIGCAYVIAHVALSTAMPSSYRAFCAIQLSRCVGSIRVSQKRKPSGKEKV